MKIEEVFAQVNKTRTMLNTGIMLEDLYENNSYQVLKVKKKIQGCCSSVNVTK